MINVAVALLIYETQEKIDYKRHFAAAQPPFECFAMLQWHAAVWRDANTAACCPE